MNRKLILLTIVVFTSLSFNIKAQEKSIKVGDAVMTSNNGTYLGTFQPKQGDVDLMPELISIRNKVNKTQHQEDLAAYKDSIRGLKRANKIPAEQGASNKTTNSIDPQKTLGFITHGNQGTPSDNTIAIGKNGRMIAAVNSSMRVYNDNATGVPGQGTQAFPLFWSPVTNKTDMCDPLVHYDPDFDRFIIFTQVCDRITTNNRILVAFSETNDPAGAYHYYSFRANLREIIGTSYPSNVWFDYPKMGVSATDLFITGNLFRNLSSTNSSYVESAIFQIDKTACFAGSSSPTAVIYNQIAGNPFTIVPASYGQNGHYGDKMYMCATRNSTTANVVRLYTITGKVTDNPTLVNDNVLVPAYSQPADGVQPGTNVDLNTGDMRGMSAFYLDNTVHFVFHSNGPNSYVAINYNRFRINGSSWSVQNKLISLPNVDCAFPSVASFGWNNTDHSAVIGFNYSSLTLNPGIRAIVVDDNMNVSNFEELSLGDNFASVGITNGTTRWGDYSGISKDHSAPVPTAWHYGMYGAANNSWRNYASKIERISWPSSTEETKKKAKSINVFPNPVIDIWSVELDLEESGALEISVFDVQGRKIKEVLNSNVAKGESLFSFNKNGLSNGTYFVRVTMNNKLVSNEKIIVAK